MFGFGKRPHGSKCRCADCVGTFEHRDAAARQFYSLLDLQWAGVRAAIVTADLARRLIDDALPAHARIALQLLREHHPELLESLLADVLD